jgi:hypothetical protein
VTWLELDEDAAVMKRMILPLMFVSVSSAGAQTASIRDLAWLQGCWELRDGDRVVEERWTAPRAGSMLGMGRTTRGEKLVEHEFILLTERDGRLAYQAHPSGQPGATFLSRPMSGREVVFENPAHDFPQRVGYRSTGPGQLLAWVEGISGGKTRRIEFTYRLVNCVAI